MTVGRPAVKQREWPITEEDGNVSCCPMLYYKE
jgi:hypothetical protein